ncbi:hypothetical protein [Nocardia canadensis]|nr:hypothetical protein [Nocardia canadensis]
MKFTRGELEVVLADALKVPWTQDDSSGPSYSKRGLVQDYTDED